MRGIVAYGTYLPLHRLDRGAIRALLGQGGGKGHRRVAGYDEDSTSLAVEAARRARWPGVPEPRSVHLATTSPAYADKTNATALHAALGLDPAVFATDHAASVRCGVGALRAAAADAGLAVLADVRTGRPGSADEADGGDGAAAFQFGEGEGVLAEIVAEASATAEFLDRWRLPGEQASHTWEERFGAVRYEPLIRDAVQRALAQARLEAPNHVIVASPHTRAARTAARGFGEAAADQLGEDIGFAGAAHVGLMLADVLDRAQPGEMVLVVSAADGADATVLRVTEAISARPADGTLRSQLASARELDYGTFLTWRGELRREPPRRPDPARPAAPPAARATGWKFGFVGSRCTACGQVHLPPQRVCVACASVDHMAPEPLAGKRATVATYTVDRLAFSLSPPVIDAVLDFEGGGRYTCELTDCGLGDVHIGSVVEMTFRRRYTADAVHNYFWKARPVVEKEG
jgi:hydroxymethylglutaryl-CoA synthase